jgi:hypothetical protein
MLFATGGHGSVDRVGSPPSKVMKPKTSEETVRFVETVLNLCAENGIEEVLKEIHNTANMLAEDEHEGTPEVRNAAKELQVKLAECFALAATIDRHFEEKS